MAYKASNLVVGAAQQRNHAGRPRQGPEKGREGPSDLPLSLGRRPGITRHGAGLAGDRLVNAAWPVFGWSRALRICMLATQAGAPFVECETRSALRYGGSGLGRPAGRPSAPRRVGSPKSSWARHPVAGEVGRVVAGEEAPTRQGQGAREWSDSASSGRKSAEEAAYMIRCHRCHNSIPQ